jgi:hypothetical protein
LSTFALGAAFSAVAFATAGLKPGSSVLAGTAIALVNLWALRSIIAVLVHAAATSGDRAGLGFFVVPKVIALLAGVWLLLSRHWVSAGPLALGYAALPIGVAIGTLVCKNRGPRP